MELLCKLRGKWERFQSFQTAPDIEGFDQTVWVITMKREDDEEFFVMYTEIWRTAAKEGHDVGF